MPPLTQGSEPGPSADDRRRLLAEAPLTVHGRIATASNATLLVELEDTDGMLAIYKPQRGEQPLWDFPFGTLHLREVAAAVVSEHLGWDVVPPTIVRDGPYGTGSVQLFVEHDPREHYFVLAESGAHDAALARMALFDLVVNNADRKGGHVLLAADGRIWGCDHGLTFHVEPKLRTVIWDFSGTALAPKWCDDLRRLAGGLGNPSSAVRRSLEDLLSVQEIDALAARATAAVAVGVLPEVPDEGRPYPWPPI